MVSRIPTFSGKRFGQRIPREAVLPVLVVGVLLVAFLLSYPFSFLAVGGDRLSGAHPLRLACPQPGRGAIRRQLKGTRVLPRTSKSRRSLRQSQSRLKRSTDRLAARVPYATQDVS